MFEEDEIENNEQLIRFKRKAPEVLSIDYYELEDRGVEIIEKIKQRNNLNGEINHDEFN